VSDTDLQQRAAALEQELAEAQEENRKYELVFRAAANVVFWASNEDQMREKLANLRDAIAAFNAPLRLVSFDALASCERIALHFTALAEEAWKMGIQERAEAFEDAVAYFRPRLIDPSEPSA